MNLTARAAELLRERTPFVHATVVRAQQPTSAHAGDQAILLSDGTIEGFVGGQCAQNSVRKAALGALQTNESVLLRVLPDGELHFPDAPGATVVVNPCLSGGALEIFLEPQLPAPLLRLCGGTPIVAALRDMAEMLGFVTEVTEVDAEDMRGATAVVIASHGGAEAAAIRSALDAGVGYIGLVASPVRGRAVVAELDLTDEERVRVHTPVGLWIGAKTSAEIAVSIVAELIKAIRLDGLAVTPAPAGPRQVIDPVCGMTVVVTADTPHLNRDGIDHWFCCPGCRTAFANG